MALDALVTRLEVTPRGEFYVGFRGQGGIHFPKWKHLFVTDILDNYQDDVDVLEEQKRLDPELKQNKSRVKAGFWWVYQLFAPIAVKERLPKGFISGHYTQQARWRTCSPGSLVTLDDITLAALNAKRIIEGQFDAFSAMVGKGAYATRICNDLDGLFDKYNGANYPELLDASKTIAALKKVPAKLMEQRKAIADSIIDFNHSLGGKYILNYKPLGGRKHGLRVEGTDFAFIANNKELPAGYLLEQPWLFLDIEIPGFREEKSEITLVGIKYVKNGEAVSEIHSAYPLGADEINGYKIKTYNNADEMVRGLTARIRELDPVIVCTHNNKFDLIKLRETLAGFPIGENETGPLFRATQNFFERIGVKDMLVFDTMRFQQIARAWEINAKLELAAGIEKGLSYDEIAQLEKAAKLGDARAGRLLGEYLSKDVDALPSIVFSDLFTKSMNAAQHIAHRFNIAIERLFHSGNSVIDFLEMQYFMRVGLYRDHVPPYLRTKTSKQKEQAARAHFAEKIVEASIEPGEIMGLFHDVLKVSIPIGDFIKDAIYKRHPELKDFFGFKDDFRNDKGVLFLLDQYARAFSRWIVTDYGFYLQEVTKLDKGLKDLDMQIFEEKYRALRQHLAIKDSDGLKRLDKGSLTDNANFPDWVETYNSENGMSLEKFISIVNQRSRAKRVARRFLGNHNVFPSRRFFSDQKSRPGELVLEEMLRAGFAKVNSFLNDYEIVARSGSYLYIKGDKAKLLSPDAPVVLVDEIPALYNADKPYYAKGDYFSNIRLKDEAAFLLCVFEMKTYRRMLDHLLKGENSRAIDVFQDAIESLENGEVPVGELLFRNKAREWNNAFTSGGITYFVESEKQAAGELFFDEANPYFISEGLEEPVKVYVMPPEQLQIDIDKYKARIAERGEALLAPIMSPRHSRRGAILTEEESLFPA